MYRVFYSLIFVLALSNSGLSQTYLSRIAKNVCALEFYDSTNRKSIKKSFGTGTILVKILDSNSVIFYIVTNKHCIPKFGAARNLYIRMGYKNPKTLQESVIVQFEVYDQNYKLSEHVRFAKNNEDVAILNFSPYYNPKLFSNLDSNLIFTNLLASPDTLDKYKISIGHEIYFLGFPSFFYDKRNISPILRYGVIATNPKEDFYFNDDLVVGTAKKFGYVLPEKFSGFLIDGNAYGGSSGSLVVLKPQPLSIAENGKAIPTINQPYILGILAESHFDIASDSSNATRLNLGGVISSKIILETINDYTNDLLKKKK